MTQQDFYAECVAPSGAYRYFQDGKWLESSSGNTVKILNPATNAAEFQVQGESIQDGTGGWQPLITRTLIRVDHLMADPSPLPLSPSLHPEGGRLHF